MIEVNAKLDMLLNAQGLTSSSKDSAPVKLSLSHLLLQINMKLEHLLGAHQLNTPDQRIRIDPVNLSASGIKLDTNDPLSEGDLVEVRMLMTAAKPFWIVVTGTVVRAVELPTGKREIAIHFSDMDESIRDEISRFALVNQKKQILARRGTPQ
jgi:c-di-GMP-binding flagellar brake protein YcgR